MSAERSNEVRLGLVMCGGVSLAIYINGISNELFRAVRGRGVYGLLKDLTDSEVVVDILSGSSAGGINAILLATALCNETEFGDTAKFWRERANFDELLKPPATHDSVLSGDYHAEELCEAVSGVFDADHCPPEPSASRFNELDLFVTGTDFNGRHTTELDNTGHALQITDHRTLFWLKHRRGRKEPFDPLASELGRRPERPSVDDKACREANITALATLGRITSCFPAAFAPVVVQCTRTGDENSPGSVDGRLTRWGNLKTSAVLIDGGVVDNKPFTSTLEAIFSRLSERPVTRHLLFVEPDPAEAAAQREALAHDSRQQPSAAQPGAQIPSMGQVIAGALSTLPRYDSVASDIKALAAHNAKLAKYLQLQKVATEAAAATGPANALQVAAYTQARRCYLIESWLEAVFEDAGGPPPPPPATTSRLEKALGALEPLPQLLSSFDVELPLRRLFGLTYYQIENSAGSDPKQVTLKVADAPAFQVTRELFGFLNLQIERLLVVRAQLRKELARWRSNTPEAANLLDENPRAFWAALVEAVEAFFASPQLATDYVAVNHATVSDEPPNPRYAPPPGAFSLVENSRFEAGVLAESPQLLAAYHAFDRIDEAAFPMEVASELHEKDRIQLTRISPFDARRGLSRRTVKLCGLQVYNFGGFLKKSWRSNDNLWGRLDAACQLTETLLDPARLRQPQIAHKLLELRSLDARVDQLFPTSDAATRQRLKSWLTLLTSQCHQAAAIQELEAPGSLILEDLILATQLEILREDWAVVLEDDIEGSNHQRRRATDLHAKAKHVLADGEGLALTQLFQKFYSVPEQGLARVPCYSLAKWGVGFLVALVQGIFGSKNRPLVTRRDP